MSQSDNNSVHITESLCNPTNLIKRLMPFKQYILLKRQKVGPLKMSPKCRELCIPEDIDELSSDASRKTENTSV